MTSPLTTEQLIEADRRDPDVAQFGGGVSSDETHAALRASVRQLGRLLGEALTRHEGAELLALVERVRSLSREPADGDLLHALLSDVDDGTAKVLARAFTAYFQLVNVTEQFHRWQEMTAGANGPLAATVARIGAALEAGPHRARTGRPDPCSPRISPCLHRSPDRGQPSLGAVVAAQDRRRDVRRRGPAPSPL